MPYTVPVSWTIWRQDDHGHRFPVAQLDSEAEALQRAAELEGAEHKQTYWVEEDRCSGASS